MTHANEIRRHTSRRSTLDRNMWAFRWVRETSMPVAAPHG
jgi:hypothetical protein